MAEQRKVGYNESLTGMGKPLERYEVLMDLTVRKGEQVTHPFDEFLQKATLTPTMKPSQHPICRQAPLSCRRVCKRKCAGLDSLHNPRNSPHMSCQIKPTCALFRDGRRLTVMAEARSISTRSVLTAHCHSYRTPRRHLRLCVCLALLLPFPIDIHHPMMGITGRQTGRPSSQNSTVLTRAPHGLCLPVYGAGQALEHAQHRRGGRSV